MKGYLLTNVSIYGRQWTGAINTGGNQDNVPQQDQPPAAADVQQDDMGGVNGGLMMDNRRERDLVDYGYMLMMLTFLIMIAYYTGSMHQFIIFFIGVAIILL